MRAEKDIKARLTILRKELESMDNMIADPWLMWGMAKSIDTLEWVLKENPDETTL